MYFGRGYGKAHRMYFWEGLSQKKGVALRAPPAKPLRDWHESPFVVCLYR